MGNTKNEVNKDHRFAPNGTGIFTYIYHKFKPYVGKYSIHLVHMGEIHNP